MILTKIVMFVLYAGGLTTQQINPEVADMNICTNRMSIEKQWPLNTNSDPEIREKYKDRNPLIIGCVNDSELQDEMADYTEALFDFKIQPGKRWQLYVTYYDGHNRGKTGYPSYQECIKDLENKESWDSYEKSWLVKPQVVACVNENATDLFDKLVVFNYMKRQSYAE